MNSRPLGLAAVVSIAAAALAGESRAACPFLTRPPVERDDLAVRLNAYAAGAVVCHGGTMLLCRSGGAWKDMGPCTAYQRWQQRLACRLEGTSGPGCDGAGAGNRPGQAAAGQTGDLGGGAGRVPAGLTGDSAGPGLRPGGSTGHGGGQTGHVGAGGSALPGGSIDPARERFAGGGAAAPPATTVGGTAAAAGADPCSRQEQRFARELQTLLQRQRSSSSADIGFCGLADQAEQLARRIQAFYSRCPSADPGGDALRYSRELLQWSDQVRRSVCVRGR